jgi:hypothetical protein
MAAKPALRITTVPTTKTMAPIFDLRCSII